MDNVLSHEEMKSYIVDTCRPYTIVYKPHLYRLVDLIFEINKAKIEGSIVECGVFKGGCMMIMAISQLIFDSDRDLYLYDTFEGMTAPSEKDGEFRINNYKKIMAGELKFDYDNHHNEQKWVYCDIDIVKKNMQITKYPDKKVHYVKGDVVKTLHDNVPDKIAFLRLDTDFYESTKKELDVLYPKLEVGGIMIVDDYFSYKGSRLATDEFLETHRDNLEVLYQDTLEEEGFYARAIFRKIK
mgnify:CR=1 FL=1|tara:strand:+ start:762 stop:1484 length:723 start_codon:yes stop_codon:yes gene_type:complete